MDEVLGAQNHSVDLRAYLRYAYLLLVMHTDITAFFPVQRGALEANFEFDFRRVGAPK